MLAVPTPALMMLLIVDIWRKARLLIFVSCSEL